MSTYYELLQTEEWLARRNDILSRDGNRCSICSNYNLIDKFRISYGTIGTYQSGKVIIVVFDKAEGQLIRCVTNYQLPFFETLFNTYSEKSLICLTKGSGIFCRLVALIVTPEELPYLSLDSVTKESIKGFSLERQLVQEEYLQSLSKDAFQKLRWIDVRFLHIHHKYYMLDTVPWDYPDEALQTLCWQCHENLHKTGTIEVFNKGLELQGNYEVCPRCFGAGYLPQFSHVQSGICFGCNGTRFIKS